jgi:hypothetical protein
LNSKLSTDISRKFCKAVEENAPSPCLTTVTQLLGCVTEVTYFYDPGSNIPLTNCKTELNAQYVPRFMILMHSWLIRVTFVDGNVFTHKYYTGNKSELIQR